VSLRQPPGALTRITATQCEIALDDPHAFLERADEVIE
jgi:hypothetical protein